MKQENGSNIWTERIPNIQVIRKCTEALLRTFVENELGEQDIRPQEIQKY